MNEAEVRNLIDNEVQKTDWEPKQVILKVAGKNFRCTCSANVFTEYEMLHYRCNGCGEFYKGDK